MSARRRATLVAAILGPGAATTDVIARPAADQT
jgi:hypothetical protein